LWWTHALVDRAEISGGGAEELEVLGEPFPAGGLVVAGMPMRAYIASPTA
jgi:hypothetical protein